MKPPRDERYGTLTAEEVRELFDPKNFSACWEGKEDLRLACALSARLGLRLNELKALRASDLHLGGGPTTDAEMAEVLLLDEVPEPCISISSGRDGTGRDLPLPDDLAVALRKVVATSSPESPNDPVFYRMLSPKPPASSMPIRQGLRSALVKMGIDVYQRRVTFHSLRRAFASFGRLHVG